MGMPLVDHLGIRRLGVALAPGPSQPAGLCPCPGSRSMSKAESWHWELLELTPELRQELQEEIACVARELALRRRVYPRFVDAKRMQAADAEREIAVMARLYGRLGTLFGSIPHGPGRLDFPTDE